MKNIGRRAFLVGAGGLFLIGILKPQLVAGWIHQPEVFEVGEEESELLPLIPEPTPINCDYVLVNGTIVDGTGSTPSFIGDLGIKGQEIVALGDFLARPGAKIIDASGLIISPGFIDIHTHTEDYLRKNGRAEMVLLQGVTSQIGGNCGTSVSSIKEYFADIKQVGVNVGLFVGYKTLRNKHVGEGKTIATQLESMQQELALGLEEGAFGLSVGLQYWPQSQATSEEIIELCYVLRDMGGFYATHIRNEENRVLSSVEEAIQIGMKAGVPVQYSHIKTSQQENWGKMSQVLELVEGASQSGLNITGDVYGYTFSSLDLAGNKNSMNEEDVRLALQHDLVMVASDSGLDTAGKAIHPRAYGNCPRIFRKYVREEGLLSLEMAIKKMTSMPAKRLGLTNRGTLAPGMKADIAVFNSDTITDCSTRSQPSILAEGMEYVFVNGQLAVAEGKPTGVLAGQGLKKV